ncbi:hypothetical protein F2981_20175 (plasmid) [Sinorhizobium meliloti]|nr:hypothetical protein [Sinorhizobium meliloti]
MRELTGAVPGLFVRGLAIDTTLRRPSPRWRPRVASLRNALIVSFLVLLWFWCRHWMSVLGRRLCPRSAASVALHHAATRTMLVLRGGGLPRPCANGSDRARGEARDHRARGPYGLP